MSAVNQGAFIRAASSNNRLDSRQMGRVENNRRAKFYSLTPDGAKYLRQETSTMEATFYAIELVLETP